MFRRILAERAFEPGCVKAAATPSPDSHRRLIRQTSLGVDLPDVHPAVARRLGALSRKTYGQLAKALRSPGPKQARLHRRGVASLDQLLAVARAADARARLGVPLAPIEEAAAALKSFVPAG